MKEKEVITVNGVRYVKESRLFEAGLSRQEVIDAIEQSLAAVKDSAKDAQKWLMTPALGDTDDSPLMDAVQESLRAATLIDLLLTKETGSSGGYDTLEDGLRMVKSKEARKGRFTVSVGEV